MLSVKFFSIWKRSAICLALGKASSIAALYVLDKSLVTVSTFGNFFNSSITDFLSLSFIIFIFLCKSLSVIIEQYFSLFLVEKSSIPIFLCFE